MARSTYVPEDLGNEVAAPSGYYVPLEEGSIEYDGRQVLYIRGNYCIEASCCGVGSWNYLRVEGYVLPKHESEPQAHDPCLEIETIENDIDKREIAGLLLDKYPGVRMEFR